ncbi:MAG: MBL fold metallo-hydrolase, partial [Planctomycetota bacterium]|nr:MBL fold metallo-hydrolase [Planctomycetota bacterium]
MKKKHKVSLAVFAALFISTAIVFKLPGNVPPPTEAGVKLPALPKASSKVEIHFLMTGKAKTLEGLTIAQGSLTTGFEIGHGAVLVKHGEDCFLFDTGLGRSIDAQFGADMPYWIRPMMAYEKGTAVVDQLESSKELPKPKRIFLSHAHWDHASGVVDFPDLEIWLPAEELEYLKVAKPPEVLPSQVSSSDIKWAPYTLKESNYAGFPRSFDVYGDGTVVLVGLNGHSPGS